MEGIRTLPAEVGQDTPFSSSPRPPQAPNCKYSRSLQFHYENTVLRVYQVVLLADWLETELDGYWAIRMTIEPKNFLCCISPPEALEIKTNAFIPLIDRNGRQDSHRQEAHKAFQVCTYMISRFAFNNTPGATNLIATTVSRRHGESPRVLITECAGASRARPRCPRFVVCDVYIDSC